MPLKHQGLFVVCCVLQTLFASHALATEFEQAFTAAAIERTKQSVRYDGAYLAIPYPGGDVPADQGVCTDVVIRLYRTLGVDLQKRVHEDMAQHFDHYPSKALWGLKRPDTNIDHRRVPNLQTFFSRHGRTLPVSTQLKDYRAGDIVTWMLPGNLPHIGVLVSRRSSLSGAPLVVHNIGRGPQLEDVLFAYPITGHYRYEPDMYQIPEVQ